MRINIVGTDTEIGKTYVTAEIMKLLIIKDYKVVGLKPIASGVTLFDMVVANEDAYKLWQLNNIGLSIKEVNPICFNEPIAPHIASVLEDKPLDVDLIYSNTQKVINNSEADFFLIEGVGGVTTPLNDNETYLDFLKKNNYPVVLVIGMQLGCLNHARLTLNTLQYNGVEVIGFIGNQIDPNMKYFTENLNYLINSLSIPYFGCALYNQTLKPSQSLTEYLTIRK